MVSHIKPASVDSYLLGICNELKPFHPDVQKNHRHHLVTRTLWGCKKLCTVPTTHKHPLSHTELAKLCTQYMLSNCHNDLWFYLWASMCSCVWESYPSSYLDTKPTSSLRATRSLCHEIHLATIQMSLFANIYNLVIDFSHSILNFGCEWMGLCPPMGGSFIVYISTSLPMLLVIPCMLEVLLHSLKLVYPLTSSKWLAVGPRTHFKFIFVTILCSSPLYFLAIGLWPIDWCASIILHLSLYLLLPIFFYSTLPLVHYTPIPYFYYSPLWYTPQSKNSLWACCWFQGSASTTYTWNPHWTTEVDN